MTIYIRYPKYGPVTPSGGVGAGDIVVFCDSTGTSLCDSGITPDDITLQYAYNNTFAALDDPAILVAENQPFKIAMADITNGSISGVFTLAGAGNDQQDGSEFIITAGDANGAGLNGGGISVTSGDGNSKNSNSGPAHFNSGEGDQEGGSSGETKTYTGRGNLASGAWYGFSGDADTVGSLGNSGDWYGYTGRAAAKSGNWEAWTGFAGGDSGAFHLYTGDTDSGTGGTAGGFTFEIGQTGGDADPFIFIGGSDYHTTALYSYVDFQKISYVNLADVRTTFSFNAAGSPSATFSLNSSDNTFNLTLANAAHTFNCNFPFRIGLSNTNYSQFGPNPTAVGMLPAAGDTLCVTGSGSTTALGRSLVVISEITGANTAGTSARGVNIFPKHLGSVALTTSTPVGGLNGSRIQMMMHTTATGLTHTLFTGQSVGIQFVSGCAATNVVTEVDHFNVESNLFAAAGTITNMHGYRARAFSNGAAPGVVTNAIGFVADVQTVGVTVNAAMQITGTGTGSSIGWGALGTQPTEYIQSSAGSTLDHNAATTMNLRIGGTVKMALTSTALSQTGDFKLTTAGNGLYIKEGTNATMGRVTLVAGVATVNTTKVTASSEIFLTVQSLGTIAVPTSIAVTARSAGTSFTITSLQITDTSVIAWQIMEPA